MSPNHNPTPTTPTALTPEDLQRSLGPNYNQFQSASGQFNVSGGAKGGESQYDPSLVPIGLNLDNVRAAKQTFLDKAGNGVVKAVGSAAGMVGSVGALAYGVFTPADVSHNAISEKVEEFNQYMDQAFPHYASEEEKKANALSPDNILTWNFLFGKVVSNFGFSFGAGALTKGATWGLAKGLGRLALSGEEGLQALQAAKSVGQGTQLLNHLNTLGRSERFINATSVLGGSLVAGAVEAQQEAQQNYTKTYQDQVDQFHQENPGLELPEFKRKEFETRASDSSLSTMLWNTALLGFDNFAQFGSSLKGGYKQALKTETSTLGKLGSRAELFFSPSEAREEGLQNLIQTGSQSYYTRKKDPQAMGNVDDMVLATFKGLHSSLETKEGQEAILTGGLSGGPSQAIHSILAGQGSGWNRDAQEVAHGQKVLAHLDQIREANPLFGIRQEAAVRHTSLQTSMQEAVKAGDVYQYNNLHFDSLKNRVQAHAQTGTLSRLEEELNVMGKMPNAEFQKMFGLEEEDFDQKDVKQYVSKLKATTKQLATTWANIETKFPQASQVQKEALYDTLTNISNRDAREKALNSQIFQVTGLDHTVFQGLNPGSTDQDYATQVLSKLAENPGDGSLTSQEVQDFLRLKQERMELVNTYQSLINGDLEKVQEPTPQPKVAPIPPQHTVPVGVDPTTGIPLPSEEEPPMEEAGDPGEETAPVQPPQPVTQPQTPQVVQPSPQAPKTPTPAPSSPVTQTPVEKAAQHFLQLGKTAKDLENQEAYSDLLTTIPKGVLTRSERSKLESYAQAVGQEMEKQASAPQVQTPTAIPIPTPQEVSEVIPSSSPEVTTPTRELKADPSYYTKSVMYMGHQLKEGYEYPASEEKFRVLHQETLPKIKSGEYSLHGAQYYVKAEEGATKAATHYNLYTTLSGQEVFLGFLQQDTKNSAGSPEQKKANEQAIQLLAQVKHKARNQYGVPTPLDVQVSASLDSLPGGVVGEKLSSDLIPATTTYGGKHTILRQKRGGKENLREITYLSGGAKPGQKYVTSQFLEHFGEDAPTDGFLLVVPTLDGKGKKLVGLTTAPASPQTFASLTKQFGKGDPLPAFLAANQSTPLGNIHTQLRWNTKGLVVQVNRNQENEDLGVLFVDTSKPITTQEEFLKALTPNEKLVGNLEGMKVKDLFSENPVREEPGEFPTPSSFTLSTTPQVWGPIYFNVTGIQTPVVSPVEDVTDTNVGDIPTPTQTPAPSSPNIQETPQEKAQRRAREKAEREEARKQAGEIALKIRAQGKAKKATVLDTDYGKARKNLAKLLPSSYSLETIDRLLSGVDAEGGVWGAYKAKVIYLFSKTPKGTEYHEAFHAVHRDLLDPALRNKVNKQMASLMGETLSMAGIEGFRQAYGGRYDSYSNKEVAELMVEEALADHFQDYMNSRSGVKGVFRKAFDLIRDFFRLLTGRKGQDIDTLFASIESGKYRTAQPSLSKGGEAPLWSLPTTFPSIAPSDKVIFGHPTIGKTFLKTSLEYQDSFISLDDDYAQDIKDFIAANKKPTEDKYQYQERKPLEFIAFTLALFDKAKALAAKDEKMLFTSNNIILDKRGGDFDKVINLSRGEFYRRIGERNTTYDVKAWKDQIEDLVAKVDPSKVVNTSGYLEDLLPKGGTTPVMAPNGKPSKLYTTLVQELGDENQARKIHQSTHTPEFKKWFGSSKAVDQNGEPLLMHHLGNKGIEAFSKDFIGSQIGDQVLGRGFYFHTSTGEIVNGVGLFRDEYEDSQYDGEDFNQSLRKKGNLYSVFLKIETPDTFPAQTQESDGVLALANWGDDSPIHGEIMVKEPGQIKSIFNKGSFSFQDNRIAYSLPPSLASGAKSKELVGKLFHQYIDRYQAYQGSPSERFTQMVEALRYETSELDTKGLADNPDWLLANRKEVDVDESTGEDYLVDLGLMDEAIPYLWKEVNANLKALNLKPTEQALELPLDGVEKQDRIDDLDDPDSDDPTDINETKERSFDANSFTLTGIGSLSQQLKSFLSLLATPIPGSSFKLPANVFGTFSLLQRNLKGLDTFEEMKARLETLAASDPTGVLTDLVTRLDAKLQAKEVDQYFINKFTRAFKTEVLNSLFTELDQDKGTARVYSANRNKEEDMLVNRWEKQYNSLKSMGTDLPGIANSLFKYLDKVEIKDQNQESFTLEDAKDGVYNLSAVGLDFSPGFLGEVFQDKGSIDIPTFTQELRRVLDFMAQGKNPFGEAKSRLTTLAKQDVLFRADIYQASYQNAEGETVYGHTAPSFEYVRARKLQDGTHDLDFSDPYYSRNYLVQHHSKGNQVVGEKMGLLQVAGGLRERSQEEGVTPKQIDPRTQIINDLALYSQQGAFRWAVHEAKATTTLVVLGAHEGVPDGLPAFVDGNGITPQGKAALLDMVHQDQLKQGKVMKELYGKPHEGKIPTTELVGGYHFLEKAPKSAPKDLPILPGGFLNGQPQVIPQKMAKQYIEAGYRNLLPTGFQYSQFPDLNTFKEVPTEKELDTFLDTFLDKATREFNDLLSSKDLGQPQHMKLLAGEAWIQDHKQFPVEDALVWKQNFLLHDLVVSNAMSQLVAGEEAFYLNHTNKTKRMAGAIASGQDLGEGSFVAATLADEDFTITPTTFGEGTQSQHIGEKGNGTDAQSYVSPSRFQFIKKQLGYSSPQTDALIAKLVAGVTLTQKESDKVMEELTANPIKGVYFNGQTYIKTSYFPLFKELTSTKGEEGNWVPIPGREKLHHLREVLEGEQGGVRDTSLPTLDELHRVSASKLQRKGVNFPNSQGVFDRGNLATQTLENRYWRLQVENPSGKTKITQGTQLMQLLDSEMEDSHPVEYQGKESTVGEVRKAYQSAMARNKVKAFTKASKILDMVVNGDSVYLEMVQDLMKESGSTQNQVDFFTQAAGQSKYSLDLPFLEQQVEKAFLSFFNKQVFQQKVHGGKVTLVSSSGFQTQDQETGEYRDLLPHRLVNGKIVPGECLMSEEYLRKRGLTKEEFYSLPQEEQDAIVTMLGFRIPTQSHHSMIPYKVVGWLPAYYGSVIVAPKEITWLSGADFDVDSLFHNSRAFRVKRGANQEFLGVSFHGQAQDSQDEYGNWKDYIQTQDTTYKFLTHKKGMSPEEAFTQMGLPLFLEAFEALPEEDRVTGHALSNQRFDGELAFITNPSNGVSLFTPATIDSLKVLKGFANKVYGVSEDNTMPYHSYATRSLQWEATTTGKANVGGAANAGKTHSWLAKHGVEQYPQHQITFSGILTDGFKHLDKGDVNLVQDKETKEWKMDGTLAPSRIADQLSTTTSGMTDDAKERLSFALNFTPSILPVLEYGISLGLGQNRVMGLFGIQPILKELAYRQQQADAQVKDKGMSSFELSTKMMEQLEKVLEAGNEGMFAGKVEDGEMLSTLDNASQNLTRLYAYTRPNGGAGNMEEDREFLTQQLGVLRMYVRLENQAKYFGYVNKLLNSNKGLPVSVQEAKDYFLTPYEKLINKKDELLPFNVLPAITQEDNLVANIRLILPTTEKSVLTATQERFLTDSHFFNQLKKTFQGLGGRNTQLQDFQMGFLTHLTMLVENQQVLNTTGKSLSEYQYLLTDPKRNITQTLAFLMGQEGLQNNLFLNQLMPKSPEDPNAKGFDGKPKGKFANPFYRLEYNTRAKNEADFVDQLSAEWLDLYSHPNSKVVDAAKELRVYLSIKDSLQFKNQSFVSLAKPNLFHNLSNGFQEGGKNVVGLKEVSDLIKQGKVAQAAAQLGVTEDQLTQDFWTKWYSIPENTKGLESWYGKNKGYAETFGKYVPVPNTPGVVVVDARAKETIPDFPVAFSEGGQTLDDGDGSYTTPKVAYILSKVDGKTAFYTKVVADANAKYQAPWAKGIVQPLILPQVVETPQEVEEVREESGAPDLQESLPFTSPESLTQFNIQAQESDLTC